MALRLSGDALADDKLSDHGDSQIREPKPLVLNGGDAQAARNAGAGELAKVEANRTNKSDGSLALDKQNESIQLFDRDASGKERVLAARRIENDVANLASQQTSISREELIIKGRAGDHAAVDLINQWRAADQLPLEQKAKVGAKLQEDADRLYGRGTPILHSEKRQDSTPVGDSLAPVGEKSKEGDALLSGSSFFAAKEQLQEVVNQKIASPQECEQFLSDMASFEKHFTERSFKGDNEKLDEMARTYAQLCRLLTAEHDVLDRYADQFKQAPDTAPMRIQVAEQIIFHAADPTTVDQGRRAVCPTAALQVRQYHRDPASVARLVADVVLIGRYTATTNDNKIDMTVCPANLIPDKEARKYNIYDKIHGVDGRHGHQDDPKRSWASQIYDVTATNLVLFGKSYRYEQLAFENEVKAFESKDRKPELPLPIDFLVNLANGSKMTWHDAIELNAGVLDSEMVKLNRWIVGKREVGFLITGAMLSEEEAKDPQVRKAYDFGHREYGEIYLYSVNDLPRILQEIQVAQAWPPIVRLDASMPPVGKAAANAHFLVIQAINDDGSKLAYDNFWGKGDDITEAARVNTNEVAVSVKHLAAKVPSLFGSAKNFATFCQNNLASWNQSKITWLDMPTKIRCQSPPQSTAVYVNTHHSNDSILANWIKQHPQDKDLSLWLQTLNEWLDKYPDEKPIDPKLERNSVNAY